MNNNDNSSTTNDEISADTFPTNARRRAPVVVQTIDTPVAVRAVLHPDAPQRLTREANARVAFTRLKEVGSLLNELGGKANGVQRCAAAHAAATTRLRRARLQVTTVRRRNASAAEVRAHDVGDSGSPDVAQDAVGILKPCTNQCRPQSATRDHRCSATSNTITCKEAGGEGTHRDVPGSPTCRR